MKVKCFDLEHDGSAPAWALNSPPAVLEFNALSYSVNTGLYVNCKFSHVIHIEEGFPQYMDCWTTVAACKSRNL